MKAKEYARSILTLLHLDLTKNLEYDRLTNKIMKRVIGPSSNCVDVGCHKGEILGIIASLAPSGRHFAFEPIPAFYNDLVNRFHEPVQIFPYALSDQDGMTRFQYVKNAPAYSGIRQRKYDIDQPDIEEIEVEMRKLDDVIPPHLPVHLIKIDVEGAEFGVLKGASRILTEYRPVIIFEFGLGASDYYGTKPADIFTFLSAQGLSISTLKGWLCNRESLSSERFEDLYRTNREYYFIAHP